MLSFGRFLTRYRNDGLGPKRALDVELGIASKKKSVLDDLRFSKLIIGIFDTLLSFILAACGSTTSSSNITHNVTGSKSSVSGSSIPTSSVAYSTKGTILPPLSNLESLTNYSFTFNDNGSDITGEVHSPSDWELVQPALELHVGGKIYTKLVKWYVEPEGSNNYQSAPYYGAVEQFVGMLKVYGAKVTKGPVCTEAGVSGHLYTIGSRALNSHYLTEMASACIADQGGAMLSEQMGATGSAVGSAIPSATKSLSAGFTVTAIGTVPVLPVPSPVTPSAG